MNSASLKKQEKYLNDSSVHLEYGQEIRDVWHLRHCVALAAQKAEWFV